MATVNPLLQQIDAIAKEKGVEPQIIISAASGPGSPLPVAQPDKSAPSTVLGASSPIIEHNVGMTSTVPRQASDTVPAAKDPIFSYLDCGGYEGFAKE